MGVQVVRKHRLDLDRQIEAVLLLLRGASYDVKAAGPLRGQTVGWLQNRVRAGLASSSADRPHRGWDGRDCSGGDMGT